jgi:hypothetical protein
MKKSDVPQEESMLEGHQRACYALDEQGRYVMVGSIGWEVEKVVNDQANEEVRHAIVTALTRVRAGEISPLGYHMARRQMDAAMLSAYSGISRLRIRWHLRPGPFARLPEATLRCYAEALQLSTDELRKVPEEDVHARL